MPSHHFLSSAIFGDHLRDPTQQGVGTTLDRPLDLTFVEPNVCIKAEHFRWMISTVQEE
jgi:hypothetical protein